MTHPDERITRATYSVDEVARLLGIARTTAYESIHRGEIPSRRFGRRIVVLRHVLDGMLAASPASTSNGLVSVEQLTFDEC